VKLYVEVGMMSLGRRIGMMGVLLIAHLFLIPPLVLVGYAEELKVAPADRQSTDEDLKDFQDFTAAREFWFETTASQGEVSPSAEFPHVFIVIMDWPINGKQTLVLAAAEGTSSLYISPGPKVLGGHSAKKEAKAVITEAEKILALAQKVSEHPLPPPGEVRFYIRTYSGLHTISDSYADLSANKGKTLQLFIAANKVMTAHLDSIDVESVPFYRKQAASNPAFQGDLARALKNQGLAYRKMGRPSEALPPTLEAVAIYRKLAASNPALLGDLARALTSLSNLYSELGRPSEALLPTIEAVVILRKLAPRDPALQSDLAGFLGNLGVFYSDLGRHAEALSPSLESVAIFRKLVASDPAFQDDLARSLNNLVTLYSELGRPSEALPPSLEEVAIRRKLAENNPDLLGDLARSLYNLGILSRSEDSLAPQLEAVAIYRTLAAKDPAFHGDLASALYNLGVSYSQLSRPSEALPPTLEAVEIRRKLAANNPTNLGDLAIALNNLGGFYSQLGRPSEALPPTLEAVAIYRKLVAKNPAFQGDLDRSLRNLNIIYRELGRPSEQLPTTAVHDPRPGVDNKALCLRCRGPSPGPLRSAGSGHHTASTIAVGPLLQQAARRFPLLQERGVQ
jgi:tetratricopeptide (TPR) repeat protein